MPKKYPTLNVQEVRAILRARTFALVNQTGSHEQWAAEPVIDLHPTHRALREHVGEWYRSPEWKAIYKQRQAVERSFSRLKGQRALNRITVRRRRKVTAHCYLSLISMQAGYQYGESIGRPLSQAQACRK